MLQDFEAIFERPLEHETGKKKSEVKNLLTEPLQRGNVLEAYLF